jgi:hypothetical protein
MIEGRERESNETDGTAVSLLEITVVSFSFAAHGPNLWIPKNGRIKTGERCNL